jgi:outer membrane lipoprotein-sorting protein
MKKLNRIFLASLLFCGINSFAQDDTKAKSILDELSKKTKTYSSIKTTFSYIMESKDSKTSEKQEGSLFLKNNKYKLEISGQEIYCDGKSISTFLKDANELQINDMPDPNAQDVISPTNIFSIYEKGFKYKFESEKMENGKTIQLINLYPVNSKTKNYHTVKLFVDKNNKQIASLKILAKDGSVYTYVVKSFTPNSDMSDAMFVFDKNKHPKVEINDLR